MNGSDFRRVRALYGETQEQFGQRLGWSGSRGTVERRVTRYESGESPVVGPLAVLLTMLEDQRLKPDTRRRKKCTATKGKGGK
jgi:transcriptional regulator with XRE-family HTH domain